METSSFVSIIIDCNPIWWGKLMEEHNDDRGILAKRIARSIASFCSSFKLIDSSNRLLVIGTKFKTDKILYSDSESVSENSNSTILKNLQGFLFEEDAQESDHLETKFSSSIAKALCHINRFKKSKTVIDDSSSSNRLLIIKLCDNVSSEHMNLMNLFFSAQKQNIAIDACVLGEESTLFQQACDITGGFYLKIDNPHGLLQNLICYFLPDPHQRPKLSIFMDKDVDYRPSCFCHHKLINVGWVCSVCLSVFCHFSPICATCQSVFKFLPALPKAAKRKKKLVSEKK